MRLGFLAMLLSPALALAQTNIVHHQGRVLDMDEKPLTGTHKITVSLYDAKEAAVAKWSEEYDVTLGSAGVYSVVLGDAYGTLGKKPITDADLKGDRWIGVKLDTAAEFSPRLILGAVARAVRAGVAENADHATKADNADHAKLADEATALVATAKVPAAQIDGTVANADKLGGKTLTELSAVFTPTNLPASVIASGKLALDRLPTGTDDASVALGNHTHEASAITGGKLDLARLPTGTDVSSVALGKHSHDAAEVTTGKLDAARLPLLPRTALDLRARTGLSYFYEAEDTDINAEVGADALVINDATASGGKARRFLGDPSTNIGTAGRLWGRDDKYFPGPIVFAARVRVSSLATNVKVARLVCGETRAAGNTSFGQDIVPAGLNTTEWITISMVCPFTADATNQFIGIDGFDKTKTTNLSLDYVTVQPGGRAEPPPNSTTRFACRKTTAWEHVGTGVICTVDIFLAQPAVVITSMNGHWYSTTPASYAFIKIDGGEPMDASYGRIHEYYNTWGTMAYTATWDLGPGKHTVDAWCNDSVCRANGVGMFGVVIPK